MEPDSQDVFATTFIAQSIEIKGESDETSKLVGVGKLQKAHSLFGRIRLAEEAQTFFRISFQRLCKEGTNMMRV
jgi:hypothetical protein